MVLGEKMIEDVIKNRIERDNVIVGGRNSLAVLFAELGFTKGAEIGVNSGRYSSVLCKTIPNLKLICIDPWMAYGPPEAITRRNQWKMEHYYNYCVKTLSPYGTKFIRMTSIEASKLVPDSSLDFVYIDAMHDFDNVMVDIILWSRKVRTGGIISGHDYAQAYDFGVIQAVDAYMKAHDITSHYITQPDYDHGFSTPSWFLVKK